MNDMNRIAASNPAGDDTSVPAAARHPTDEVTAHGFRAMACTLLNECSRHGARGGEADSAPSQSA